MAGVEGVEIQWLLAEADGTPNFAMRRIIVAPGGVIPLHDHDWEHEIYVLSGHGEAMTERSTFAMTPGDALLALPGERHGFRNTGDEELAFICVIPNPESP